MWAKDDTLQPGQTIERPCILVVERQTTMRQVLSLFLTAEGYDVVGAFNGCDALLLLHYLRPDLILLDLTAPVTDDFAFLLEYQQTPGPHAPVVLVSVLEPLALRGLDLGAADFLLKPIHLEKLSELVQAYLA